jgi:hypothetical protein
MRCHEAERLLAPQFADCLDAATQHELALHLDACPACRARLQQEYELDRLVVSAVNRDVPSVNALTLRIAQQVNRKPAGRESVLQWRWPAFAGAAALVLVFAIALFRFNSSNPMHLLCADAIDDHRTEVVLHEPRHWQTTPAGIAELARRTVSRAVPQSVSGLPLEKARICGLLDATALHLVYGKGAEEVSVFLMPRQQLPTKSLPSGAAALVHRIHQEHDAGIFVASFADSSLGVVVVGGPDNSRDVADQLLRSL